MSGYVSDDDNRLTSDGTYDYEYDAEGNRTKRTHVATGTYEEYAWDHRKGCTVILPSSCDNRG
jgi:YD repeat-containing protein